jgi:hypothetical protein
MANLYGPRIVTDGLVLHLDAGNRKSYPGSGTSWNDLSGNANNATMSGGVSFSTLFGGCLQFSASTNDYAVVADNSTLDLETAWTIETWIRQEGTNTPNNYSKIVSKWENYFISTGNTSNYLYGCVGTGSGHTCNSSDRDTILSLNEWACLVFAYSENSGTAELYWNNAEAHTVSASATAGSSYDLTIARPNTGITDQTFTGKISVVKVYNKKLTTTEILQNYNALKGRFGL